MVAPNSPRMPRRPLGLLALLLIAATPAAAGDVYGKKRSLDARISGLQAKIEDARRQEGVLTSEISAVTSRIRVLESRVGSVSERLAALEESLALHRRRLDEVTALFDLETRRLAVLRRQHAASVARLNHRLVAIYQANSKSTIAAVFASTNLSDLIDDLDYSTAIGQQDKRIATQVRYSKERLRKTRERTRRLRERVAAETRAIAERTAEARAERDRLLASQQALAAARAAKRETLASVRHAELEFAGEAAELARASAQLAEQIRAAQSAAAPDPVEPSSTPVTSTAADGIPSTHGLVWPVSGPVVSGFGMRWGRMHEGIDIAAPTGTPIRAAAGGSVISAGWQSGYGNLVVIDHGGGLATAYAHQSGMVVGAGQGVVQGQVIGYVGCTGHCYGPHLHFEVRVNGAPVDPLAYL